MPRFTVINKLTSNIKLMQPTGFGGESLSVALSARNICLYHLPDVYADRKVSIQLEESSAFASPWSKTVAFNIDEIGALTLSVKRKHYLANMAHVVTRSSPVYSVVLPAHEIGI